MARVDGLIRSFTKGYDWLVNEFGEARVRLSTSASAFNEANVAQLTPVTTLKFAYNINSDLVNTTTSGTGTITQANSQAVLSTSAAASSSALLTSRRFIPYTPGQGGKARFTAVFTTGVANSLQEIGVGDDMDGFFFAYNGADFCINRRQNGVDNYVTQANWSEVLNGSASFVNNLDFTKGNVFEIQYQWLGYGEIRFSIENPITGRYELVHKIQYANTAVVPSVFNPSFPVRIFVENTTNTSDIVLKCPSAAAYIEGLQESLGIPRGKSNLKTSVGTTLTNIITLRNKETYASITNRIPVELEFFSYGTNGVSGGTPAQVKVIKDVTLGGSPSFSDIDTNNSPMEFDIAGTTITGGQDIFDFNVGNDTTQILNLSDRRVFLTPGESITLAAKSGTGTSDFGLGITWREFF